MRFLFSVVFFAWFVGQYAREEALKEEQARAAGKRAFQERLNAAKAALMDKIRSGKPYWTAIRKRLTVSL